MGRVSVAALAAGAGAAALRTTIVARETAGTLEFVVVGPAVRQIIVTIVAVALAVIVVHLVGWRTVRGGDASHPQAGGSPRQRWLTPLVWCALPVAGVAAAMRGAPGAPFIVYWTWELAPWWFVLPGAASVARLLRETRLAASAQASLERLTSVRAGVLLVATLIVWVLVTSVDQRRWTGPSGDEPRYLRHAESWYQGQGEDISKIARITDQASRQPHLLRSLAFAGRALVADAAGFASDLRAWLTQPGFTWNRAHGGDGSFLVGRTGGVYQFHQPGFAILLMPAYMIDRGILSRGTVYDGQFPDRAYSIQAALLAIAALGAIALAVLCRQAGCGVADAAAFALLAWCALPASALVLQVYPETFACLAVTVTLIAVNRTRLSVARATLLGLLSGYPLLLHMRFLAVSMALLGYAVWRMPRQRTRVAAFVAGWAIPAMLQIWYAYHATGLPWPTAFYLASDVESIAPSIVPINLVRYAIDRNWGIVPHLPLLLLAAAGLLPLWRRRRDLAIAIPGLLVLLTATAGAHTLSAAGGTPDRLIMAAVPLMIVPIAAGAREWWPRPIYRVVFVLLAILTLAQAWDYNRGHLKGMGALLAPGASGWRINLLFPNLADGLSRVQLPATLAVGGTFLLVTLLLARSSRLTRLGAAGGSPRYGVPVALVAVAIAMWTSTASAWQASHPRYRHSDAQARTALVGAYLSAASCALCWSSMHGAVGPESLAPNPVSTFQVDHDASSSTRVNYRVTATGPAGPVFGTLRFDFGDGQVSAPVLMSGTSSAAHDYRAPGDYAVKAWLDAPGAPRQIVSIRVHVGEAAR